MRDIVLTKNAREQLQFFISNDRKLSLKIFDLIDAIIKDLFMGIGKPEALKGDLSGYWSHRINDEHRIIYQVTNESIVIISCRSHYK